MNYTLNVKGQLMSLAQPKVMGILNVTPDSFYAASRTLAESDIARRAEQIVEEGGTFIDVGACSTRPGSTPVSQETEMERLRLALGIIQRTQPAAIVSVDTFRSDVARMAVEEYGADIINDVSGGDDDMLRMVSRLGVAYVLTSEKPTLEESLLFFATQVQRLRDMGHKDVILDPGFGFGKTLAQNYSLMTRLEQLQVMDLPLLVGVSRKSMIYKLLDVAPEGALNGTTALNMVALMKGAAILRVHDVREAAECVKLMAALNNKVEP